MKAVADTLDVARSHLAERLRRPARPRGPYHKPEDAQLLPTIRAIVDARPSYGYRRVTALVNRALRSRGEASVNAKRVLPGPIPSAAKGTTPFPPCRQA